MSQVGIRAFKSELRRYLREVAKGRTLLLTDRGRVIAEVSPPAVVRRRPPSAKKSSAADQLADLIERRVARPAVRPNRDWMKGPLVRLRPGTVRLLLDADRAD